MLLLPDCQRMSHAARRPLYTRAEDAQSQPMGQAHPEESKHSVQASQPLQRDVEASGAEAYRLSLTAPSPAPTHAHKEA